MAGLELSLLGRGKKQGRPALAVFLPGEGQAERLGVLLQGRDVAFVESAEEELASGTEDGDIGIHIVEEDVAIDIGYDYVEFALRGLAVAQQVGIAYVDGDVGMVALGIFEGIAVGPLVDVDGFHV